MGELAETLSESIKVQALRQHQSQHQILILEYKRSTYGHIFSSFTARTQMIANPTLHLSCPKRHARLIESLERRTPNGTYKLRPASSLVGTKL